MDTFSALLALCAGIHRSPVNSPHKDQWRGALMFSLICAWTNGCVHKGEPGNLRRDRAYYDVDVMILDSGGRGVGAKSFKNIMCRWQSDTEDHWNNSIWTVVFYITSWLDGADMVSLCYLH